MRLTLHHVELIQNSKIENLDICQLPPFPLTLMNQLDTCLHNKWYVVVFKGIQCALIHTQFIYEILMH